MEVCVDRPLMLCVKYNVILSQNQSPILRFIPGSFIYFGGKMARITVEDCLEKVNNRFLIVQMAIKRVKQFHDGYEPLVQTKNKEVVTALREIAEGKVLPDVDSIEDLSFFVDDQEE